MYCNNKYCDCDIESATAFLEAAHEKLDGHPTVQDEIEDLLDTVRALEDTERCPGCGCFPGEGKTPGCDDSNGCGHVGWA